MTFKDLLEQLRSGKSFEDICEEQNNNMVECVSNEVYDDGDLEDFLEGLGACIEDFGVGYAIISTSSGEVYELPYEERANRFDSDLPNETVLFFEINKIYDVTQNYKSDEKDIFYTSVDITSKINLAKLEEYLKQDMILEFESPEECMNYFNVYDYQKFRNIDEMKSYQGEYGFGLNGKWYHINYDEALDVWDKEEKNDRCFVKKLENKISDAKGRQNKQRRIELESNIKEPFL